MKKMLLSLIVSVIITAGFSQSKNHSGKGLYIGTSYSQPSRTQFDQYMKVASDSLHLGSSLVAKNSIGIHAGYCGRSGNNEVEAGVSLFKTLKAQSTSTTNGASSALSETNIDIHFGYNHYMGALLLGFDVGALSNAAKLTFGTNANSYPFELAPDNSNPFKGYCMFVRPKAGFFFPFKKAEGNTGIRINAFYDLGLTKYKFYDNGVINQQLKTYTGNKQSSYSNAGIELILLFSVSK
jgi:hypothetical protein